MDYDITVPENTTVRTHSGSGDQSMEGIKGTIDLEAGSGDMQLSRLTGDLRFQTGSGNVRGRQLSGPERHHPASSQRGPAHDQAGTA